MKPRKLRRKNKVFRLVSKNPSVAPTQQRYFRAMNKKAGQEQNWNFLYSRQTPVYLDLA